MACSERSITNLGDPSASFDEVGRINEKKSVRRALSEGSQIIQYYSETVTPITCEQSSLGEEDDGIAQLAKDTYADKTG